MGVWQREGGGAGTPYKLWFFLLYINDLPNDISCKASDLRQTLELASELESDLRDTVDWGRNWLVDFSAGEI